MPSAGPYKRRNHEVPRGLLKNWKGSSANAIGFHYFDLDGGEIRFERGKKANFAISNYLYVPIIGTDTRDQTMEDWFSVDETGLAPFAVAAQVGNPNHISNGKILNQAIRACIALGYRSAYQFYKFSEQLNLGAEENRDDLGHLEAVKNAWRIFEKKFDQFKNWDFSVIYNLPGNLLINEQPFRDWTVRHSPVQMVSMPLGPNALLTGTPPNNPARTEMALQWYPQPENRNICQWHNEFMIETARKWLIANNRNQLEELSSKFSPEAMKERISKDRSVIL